MLFRLMIEIQIRLSEKLDRLFPGKITRNGYWDMFLTLLPSYIGPGMKIIDVGGGRTPAISVELKRKYELKVTGLDINREELENAPGMAYNKLIQADVCKFDMQDDADLVICLSLMEHLQDTRAAFKAMSRLLKPGGKLIVFVPCRNSIFARINLLLPENIKRKILFSVFPESKKKLGFTSYYNRCTPDSIERIAANCGFELTERRCYYSSRYFMCFLPLHALYRSFCCLKEKFFPIAGAETFAMVFTPGKS